MHDKHYDFIITDIVYTLERQTNSTWKFTQNNKQNNYIIALPLKGKAVYSINEQIHHVSRGDLLLFPKGQHQRSGYADPDEPWSFISVAFDIGFLGPLGEKQFDRFPVFFHHLNQLHEITELFFELNRIWTRKRPGYLIRCRAIITEIMYLLIRHLESSVHDSHYYDTIEKIAHHISVHYNKSFSLSELTDMSGISESHFRSLFRTIIGYAPVEYQHRIKVHKAKDMLLSGDCNVSEAAERVGFQDIYYFSKVFKKITGISPSKIGRQV